MRRPFATGFLRALVAISSAPACVAPALAASDDPARPITVIVPFAAGGPTDILAPLAALVRAETERWVPAIRQATARE